MRLAGPLTADQDRQLQRIQSAGGSLLVLINDVLDLAKWNQARSKLRGKKPPAAKILNEVAAIVRPIAEERSLSVAVDLPEPSVTSGTHQRALTRS